VYQNSLAVSSLHQIHIIRCLTEVGETRNAWQSLACSPPFRLPRGKQYIWQSR